MDEEWTRNGRGGMGNGWGMDGEWMRNGRGMDGEWTRVDEEWTRVDGGWIGRGFIRYGYFGGLSYGHYFSGNFYLKATSFVSRITLTPAKLKVNSVGFDIMPAYTLYKKNAAFFVSAMAGMSFIVSENIKEKDIIGDKANKLGQLKTGFLGGIEMADSSHKCNF